MRSECIEVGNVCVACGELWPCRATLTDQLAAVTAERDAAAAPCSLNREYRDGVTCRAERVRGVCFNHRVVAGLRVHAVTADRLELENRALLQRIKGLSDALRDIANNAPTLYGYARANEALVRHGSPPAALAAASEGASPVTTRTITMRCHCGRGVTIGPDPWCEGCVQSAATCDCVPATQGEG